MERSRWTRRQVLTIVAGMLLPLVGHDADAAGAAAGPPRDAAARRRWALARMDEMGRERLRCRERFDDRRRIRACEAEFERRHREYNELYLEAARE